jgi:hypothetical protein
MLAASIATLSGTAQAATINLLDWGGVKGSRAEQGFKIAADYWGAMLTNNATINLGVGFWNLGEGTVGATDSYKNDYSIREWENRFNATKSNSTLDRNIVLPTLNDAGNISFITNGVAPNGSDDTAKLTYLPGNSYSSNTLYLNNAVAKALVNDANYGKDWTDGQVTFSDRFQFDFDPRDGISPGQLDFLGVAIHEIGHALGFVSGTDYLDYFGYPNGPYQGQGWSNNSYSTYSSLDMFRYSKDPKDLVYGNDPVLDLSVGTDSYFSIDGGKTALFDNKFATGTFNGDGYSTSHWKHGGPCNNFGIMDPVVCYGHNSAVSALDLAAFDAMGWNIAFDVLANPNYLKSTAEIFAAAVPEPASWLTMILGFGLTGGVLRHRVRKVQFAAA